MSTTFATLRPEYERLLASVRVTRTSAARAAAQKIFDNSNRYKQASQATGVPWPLIGVLDLRESDCNPRAALGQGDPWNQVSTHVPRGKGPFKSWADAAKYYLHYDGVDDPPAAWDMAVVCWEGEKWNGWGYRNKGIFSPYLWAGTNHYTSGKYVADGVFDRSAVDQQLGIIPVLYEMVMIDPTTYIGAALPRGGDPPPPVPAEAPFTFIGTRWIQSRLNVLMVAASDTPEKLDLLVVDGNYGRLTRAAVRGFQEWVGITVDGQAGDETTAAMDKELQKIR